MSASRTRLVSMLTLGLALTAPAQQELAIPRTTPKIDGDLSEWPAGTHIRLGEASQVLEGKESWGGVADVSGDFRVAFDTNHLYLAGQLRDDQIPDDQNLTALARFDSDRVLGALFPELNRVPSVPNQVELQPLHEQ